MEPLSHDIAQRVVDRLAVGLATSVSVTDTTGRVLASTCAHTRGTRIMCARDAVARNALCQTGDGKRHLLSLPLTHADAIVGAIVFEGDAEQDQALGRISQTLAELIIHQAILVEQLPTQSWVHNKFVFDVLHGQFHSSPELMLQEATLLGIDLRVPRIVTLVNIVPLIDALAPSKPTDNLPQIARQLRLDQLHADLQEHAQQVTRLDDADVYSFIDDHRLIMLTTVDAHAPHVRRKEVMDRVQQFLDDLMQRFDLTTSAGIGRYYPGWQALSHSFKDAQFAFETGRALQGPGRVFCVEDLGVAGLLWSDDRATKVALAHRLLQPLDDDADLLQTLTTFLSANLSPSKTAQVLHVHRHTLGYRLDKITQLTGLDPRMFDAAAQLSAALLLCKLDRSSTT